MVITGLLVRTKTGAGEKTAAWLREMPDVEVQEVIEDRDIVVVMESQTMAAVRMLFESLSEHDEVVGVFPAYTYLDE